VTLFVKELLGDRPDLATLTGIAFSITGLANVFAAPFLGNKSNKIGYRRVLLIALLGASLTTLPQAFAGGYWSFTVDRLALGLFNGGILPTANALVAGSCRERSAERFTASPVRQYSRQFDGAAFRRRSRRRLRVALVILVTAAAVLPAKSDGV
jgi:MFS family permease